MRRLVGLVVATGLTAGACAHQGDHSNGDARRATTATTTALTTSVAGVIAQPQPDPGAVAPAPPSSVAVPAAARTAWRTWAGALARGDLATATSASQDGANSWTLVLRVPAEADARSGQPHAFSGSPRDGAGLAATTDTAAFEADLVLTEKAPSGLNRQMHITQPVLRHTTAGWKVASCTLDGVPLRFAAPGLSRTTEGVTTTLLTVLGTGAATFAITRSSVASGQNRNLTPGPASLTAEGGRQVPAAASTFSTDVRPVIVWRFAPIAVIRSLDLTLLDGSRKLAFSFSA